MNTTDSSSAALPVAAPAPALLDSPSLKDGFNGALDEAILRGAGGSAGYVTPQKMRLICTKRTKPLLHRAGIKRTRMFEAYTVRVQRDRFGRLQLAPSALVAALDA